MTVRVARNDIDDNVSLWAHTVEPAQPYEALRGETTADMVIIGAGFTGLSTAYEMNKRFPDKRIVILEAKRVGNGASGRNGGMMLNWVNGVDTHDETITRRIWDCTKGGIDWIENTIRTEGLSVRYRRDGCLETYTAQSRAEEAHAKVERLAKWGIPISWLQGKELAERITATNVVGAILDPTAGQLHGLDFVRELARVVASRGVVIHEDSPVVRIEEGPTHAVATPGGSVRAPSMVLAVNGYASRLGYFGSEVFPLHSHCIATPALSPERWEEIGWGKNLAGASDDLDRISFASMTPDGRLLFGGGSNQSYAYLWNNKTSHPVSDHGSDAVRKTMLKYFPKLASVPIEERWSGVLGITMNRRPSMGVRGEHKNVYFALGYSGHGVVLANIAGSVLTDLYSGDVDRWKDQPFVNNRLIPIPPEPFRWVGYHVFTRLTGRSPRKVA